jgi:queuosine precursor transporter
MYLAIPIAAYAAAMTLANLIVAHFVGTAPHMLPVVTGINAFLLIGFDLAMRDWLHVKVTPMQMLALIVGSGAVTYVLNPAAGVIAVASAAAFTSAALADWAVFSRLSGSWLRRANLSNVAGAAVDSLVFPTIAFGALMPQIVLVQFVAKVAGGAVWSLILRRKMVSA